MRKKLQAFWIIALITTSCNAPAPFEDLASAVAAIPPPVGASEFERLEHREYPSRSIVITYKTALSEAQIFSYYSPRLIAQHWVLCDIGTVSKWGKDTAEREAIFARGRIEFVIDFLPGSNGYASRFSIWARTDMLKTCVERKH